MNCKFCSQSLEETPVGKLRFIHYICQYCNATFVHNRSYGYRGFFMDLPNNRIYHFPFSKHPCRLVDSESRIILELDHFPDINPQNAQRWVDKLLKLKAFA